MPTTKADTLALLGTVKSEKSGAAQAYVWRSVKDNNDPRLGLVFTSGDEAVGFWSDLREADAGCFLK